MTLTCIRCRKRLARPYALSSRGPVGPRCAVILGLQPPPQENPPGRVMPGRVRRAHAKPARQPKAARAPRWRRKDPLQTSFDFELTAASVTA